MELQKTKHQLQLEQWRVMVQECRSSGMTVAAWCTKHSICTSTYYRRQKMVWEAGTKLLTLPVAADSSQISFAEYTPPTISASPVSVPLTLHIGQATLEIRNGAEPSLIESTLRVLTKLC